MFLRLSSLNTYFIPRDGNLESYQDYIQVLPNIDRPEAFGQHPNADIATLITDTRVMFETMLSLQMQASSGSGGSSEDKVSTKIILLFVCIFSLEPSKGNTFFCTIPICKCSECIKRAGAGYKEDG